MTYAEMELKEAEKIARGLISIARVAMPDSYFASDSRVKRAQEFLSRVKARRKTREALP